MKLIDTTVAVDYLRGMSPAVNLLDELIGSGEEVVSSELVRFELLAGVREDELASIENFFNALVWVSVEEEVARIAGQLAARHRRRYSGIDDVDCLIAATAIVLEAELLTTNLRHFPMLPNVRSPYVSEID